MSLRLRYPNARIRPELRTAAIGYNATGGWYEGALLGSDQDQPSDKDIKWVTEFDIPIATNPQLSISGWVGLLVKMQKRGGFAVFRRDRLVERQS